MSKPEFIENQLHLSQIPWSFHTTFKEDAAKLKALVKATYDKFKTPQDPEVPLDKFNIGNLRAYSKNDYKFAKIMSSEKAFID